MTDQDTTVPDEGPSVSIAETAWGTVVSTRKVVGIAAAVLLRRRALRHRDGVVLLDLRATCAAEPVVARAIADLADGLRGHGGVLRVVSSPRTPQALVAAAGAPEYTSLAEAFGGRLPAPPMPHPRRSEGD